MNLDPFSHGTSALHRRDPRVKLVVTTAYAVVVAVMQDMAALVPALMLAVLLTGWARLPWRPLLRRLLVVNGFVAVLWMFLPFTHPGTPVYHIGRLTASREGVLYAANLTLRTNTIVLATMALLGTTPVFDLVHALHHLRVPEKLAQVAFFTIRYLDVIHREYLRLRNAMRVRCFQPRTSLHTYISYAHLVGMLLVRSYERSQRVYQAMLCRGFQGSFPVYRHFRLGRADLVFGTAMLLAVGMLCML